MVRSALMIACSYLILFSEGSAGMRGPGLLVIVLFLTSNLVVGRLRAEVIDTQSFNLAIAAFDTMLIAMSLLVAGQMSVELVVLLLGVVVLAIAGLRFGVIAAVTLGMTAAYMLMLWLVGRVSLTRSTMLLQVPFLLCAAMLYGWITEAGHEQHPADAGAPPDVGALTAALSTQLEGIRHCQALLSGGSQGAALAGLDTIAAQNLDMQAKLASVPATAPGGTNVAPSLARSAA